MRRHYEKDKETWNADAYAVEGYRGIAWYVLGWETEPDEDTEWTGIDFPRSGVAARLLGLDDLLALRIACANDEGDFERAWHLLQEAAV